MQLKSHVLAKFFAGLQLPQPTSVVLPTPPPPHPFPCKFHMAPLDNHIPRPDAICAGIAVVLQRCFYHIADLLQAVLYIAKHCVDLICDSDLSN